MDATRVRLVSSRNVTDPLGRIEARVAFGYYRFDIFARAAPDNPKTSPLTAYSILQCARVGGHCRSRDFAGINYRFPAAHLGHAAHVRHVLA
jgi:hypothetical protein